MYLNNRRCTGTDPVCKKILHCVSKKVGPLMFDNNFGKCGSILKTHQLISTSPAICCYTTFKFENPKMLPNFHVERDN